MKHITKIILIVLLFSYSVKMNAQSGGNSLQAYLNYSVSGLDPSKIQSGLLYNKTTHFLNLSKYNGLYDTITTYIDAKWLLNRVNQMQVDTGRNISTSYLDFKLKKYDSLKVNPIIILNYKYDQIKSNAFESGLIDTLNNRFVDVTNPSQSPYEQDYIITATFAFPTMGLFISRAVNFTDLTKHKGLPSGNDLNYYQNIRSLYNTVLQSNSMIIHIKLHFS